MEAQLSTEAFGWGRASGENGAIVLLSFFFVFLLLLISRLRCLHVEKRAEFFLNR